MEVIKFPTPERTTVYTFNQKQDPDYPQKIDFLEGFEAFREGNFAKALAKGAGLSFSYEKRSAMHAMKTLEIKQDTLDSTDPEHPKRSVRLLNEANGLCLDIEYTYYPKHKAVLIGGEIKNLGKSPIKHVTQLLSFDVAFDTETTGDIILHTIGGGTTHFIFPPLAFHLDEKRFMGSLYTSMRIDSSDTGRSSDNYMPFFYMEDEKGGSGIYCGLEWTGLWHVDFARRNAYMYIKGGMDGVNLTLRPGESIPVPRALIGFYRGSIHEGRNAMRRFIRDWYPRYRGGDLEAPVTWNHAFTFCATINEEIFKRQVPVNADLGFDWMQIDWGWFSGCVPPINCTSGIGNWNEVDPERFPNGIKPLADLVRSYGMKYCTWVDPEQVHPSTWFAGEHSDWILYLEGRTMGLVDFGKKEVQDWFIEYITGRVQEWGIHKLKWDNNIDPNDYWSKHDDPEHRGLLQIRHIRGVYRVWDEIRRLNPSMVLENCSSGGRRFDLGTFAHAHIHHGSDFNFHNDIIRTQISGANTVIPTYRVIHTCTWGGPDFTDTYVQSRFGGILRFSQDFASWPEEARMRIKKHIAVYKSIRHLLSEDFYALFPQPLKLTDWDGWQYNNPETGEGFILAFRMRGPEAAKSPCLRGLCPDTKYSLTDPYTGEQFIKSGRDLMEQGIAVTLEPDTAKLLQYKIKTL